jgi:hypothetical protein
MAAPTDRTVKGPIVRDEDLSAFTADGALDKFDLVYLTSNGKVKKHDGTTKAAIGIVDRAYADAATDVSVLLLSRGRVLAMRAASAIAVGDIVMAVADGECDNWAATVNTENVADPRQVGVCMLAAASANDIVEVLCL